jgi:hypothetical protein
MTPTFIALSVRGLERRQRTRLLRINHFAFFFLFSSFTVMNYLFVFICFVAISFSSVAQTIPSARTVNWSLAGLRDSVPDFQNVVNIKDYGANADGITPDDSAFNAAMSALGGSAGVIFFPADTYAFAQSMTLPDSIILRGEGADSTMLKFVAPVSGDLIRITGNATSTKSFLVNDALKEDSYIIVDSSFLFVAGDYIKLTFNDSLLVLSTWAYNTVGQIIEVDAVSGDTLHLASPLRMDYPLSGNPMITKINPKKNVGIECLKILRTVTDAFQSSNISIGYAAKCWLKGMESDSCNFAHVEISNSTNIRIFNSYFHDAFDYGGGGKGYGVMIQFTSGECLVENNNFKHLRHSMILQAGANGNVFGYNYSIDPFWTGVSLPANSSGDMVLHGNYVFSNLFEGNIGQNIVIDDSHGSNGPYNTFFRNRADLFGIFMNNAPASNNQNLVGNEITNNTFPYGLYLINGTGHFEYGNNVKGTITPAGTNTLPDTTYYLNAKPSYLNNISQYPLIGIPNTFTVGDNRAKLNYAENILTYCASLTPDSLITDAQTLNIESLTINVFPNPAESELHIHLSSEETFTLSIINSIGEVIAVTDVVKEKTVTTTALSSGIYYLRFSNTNKESFYKKIIIQ